MGGKITFLVWVCLKHMILTFRVAWKHKKKQQNHFLKLGGKILFFCAKH